MGKKKDKQKQKAKQSAKVSRQSLEEEIERLRLLTEQLQARLERIAEIATFSTDAGAPMPGNRTGSSQRNRRPNSPWPISHTTSSSSVVVRQD